MRTITSVPDAPAPRTVRLASRPADTLEGRIKALRHRAEQVQHGAMNGEWRIRTIKRMLDHADRDSHIRPRPTVENDLRIVESHIAALESRQAEAVAR